MKEFWNERYSEADYAYGEEPNNWFKSQIDGMKPGKILLPAEGEGRNAVYAARLGWEVYAFDQSIEGKNKAEKLAGMHKVKIDYRVGELSEIQYEPDSFDLIVLIFAHFAPGLRQKYHRLLASYLKSGGHFLVEGFSKKQLTMTSSTQAGGGPKNEQMLYSVEELRDDFKGFDIIDLTEKIVHLNEGQFHVGNSSVLRFIGRKI